MVGCSVGLENLCLDNLDANADGSVVGWGVLVEVLVLLYGFLAVAIIADNHLVTSLETLCVRWNVREDVAGASFMAFGSAAPEIIINAVSTIKTVLAVSDGGAAAVAPEDAGEDTDLGIGAIIGSGMIAFTVIPGVCGLAAKEDLALKRRQAQVPKDYDQIAWLLRQLISTCTHHTRHEAKRYFEAARDELERFSPANCPMSEDDLHWSATHSHQPALSDRSLSIPPPEAELSPRPSSRLTSRPGQVRDARVEPRSRLLRRA